MREACLVTTILALSALALGVPLDNVLLVAVDKIPDHVYVILNSTPVPLPKVYILELKDAIWAEGTYNPKKPINLTVPIFSGPYLAVPKRAEKVNVERGKKAVLEINGEAYEILYTDNPERDGLPPTRIELVIKGREIQPGVYEIDNRTVAIARGRWRVQPEASTATVATPAFDRYIFRIHSPPVSTRGSFSVRFTYATDFNTAAKTYSYTTQTYAYVGRGVTAINVAIRGAPVSSVRLNIYYSDTPTAQPPAYTQSLTANAIVSTNYGYIYSFQIPSSLRSKYLWISVDISTGPWDLPVTFEPTVTVEYERPSPLDSTWSHMVYSFISALVEDNFYSKYQYKTSRIFFIGKVPQGAAPSYVTLYIGDMEVYNCAGKTYQYVRVYVGGTLAGTISMILSQNGGLCQVFKSPAMLFYAAGALRLFQFNSSLTDITLEFDPPLIPPSGSNYYPYVKMTSLKLYGYKWPEIWVHNSTTWSLGKFMIRSNLLLYNITGDEILVNIWRTTAGGGVYDPKTNRNETNPHILAKAELTSEIPTGIYATSGEWPLRATYTHVTYNLPGNTYLLSICWATTAPAVLFPNTKSSSDYWTPINFLIAATQAFITGIQAYNELAVLLGWTTLYSNPLVGLGLTALSVILSAVQGPSYGGCSVTVGGVTYNGPYYSAGVDLNVAVRSAFVILLAPGTTGGLTSYTIPSYVRVYYYRDNEDSANFLIDAKFKAPVISLNYWQEYFNGPREYYAYGSVGGVIIPLVYP
ncbi:hypothetical protein [Pyrobaculum ferrireducens]|uniref:Uncharacterized protein n=1 Tax=Pyrobaculum ferrireducens TaxID=1104324 RepID=G7VGE6_9CREN|nr:hypothetical protein [Pyrobaculum ferrireducens]AET31857.1 hypothetical protein P186_0403 [Pyrobaculum ferrireducens]